MISKKTGGYIMLALIMAVMIPVIVFITRSFSMTCQDGYHWDKTSKKCVQTCSDGNINQPTLDYKCGQCPEDYIVNNKLCVKKCRSNSDCPKSSTGDVQKCVGGLCADHVWSCNKKPQGGVCESLEGDITSGTAIYSSLKDCKASGCAQLYAPYIKSRDRVIMAFALHKDSVPLSNAQKSTVAIWHPLINAHTDMDLPCDGPNAVVTKQGYTYSDLVNKFKNNYVVITHLTDSSSGKLFAQTDFFRIWAPYTSGAYTNHLTLGAGDRSAGPSAAWENPHCDPPDTQDDTAYKFELPGESGNLQYRTAYGKLGSKTYKKDNKSLAITQEKCNQQLDPGQSGCGYLGFLANYSAVIFAPVNNN
jgi:hypothetical protein